MAPNKRVTLNSYIPRGTEPNESFLSVEETTSGLEPLNDGDIRLKTLYVSVDPYLRGRMNGEGGSYAPPYEIGQTIQGSGVGRVLESRNPNYNVGDVLTSQRALAYPFQSVVVFNAEKAKSYTKLDLTKVPEHLISSTIGFLGMPGLTSYFGLTERAQIKEGDTIVVSGAAGACGSVAGQVARLLGCKRVIGIVGTEEKAKFITQELGFDSAILYKGKSRDQLIEEIRKAAPSGVDIYFDNVGGEISNAVIANMNQDGRIPICGQISQYNLPTTTYSALPEDVEKIVKEKNLSRAWFMYTNYLDKLPQAWEQLFKWTVEGKLKVKETFFNGIEEWPKAFVGLFSGDNTGKAVVRLNP